MKLGAHFLGLSLQSSLAQDHPHSAGLHLEMNFLQM